MRTDIAPKPTRLQDYKAPNFNIKSVYLDVKLHPTKTHIISTLDVEGSAPEFTKTPFRLDGEDIHLRRVKINGETLKRSDYKLTQTELILTPRLNRFTLEITTECNPTANTRLMGLYISNHRFCTQCEAEGFRRITYYPDRPDVLSVFTIRLTAPKQAYPYLLANGNCTESADIDDTSHYAVWHDPFPKPCYLVAMVAGEFDALEDEFTTMSGRNIPLSIYVDPGDAPRAAYAMDALKRSMKWDEDAFGREYDLDRFMIVAVRDFNFGAMENKGLNIFNSALLLADATTATDMNFERIESVVAHEYFHNWSGNRITCRDWFQLCLKEGFTVFRDQEFSASQRGASVQRIKDVRALRARQFIEDAGPLSHPVRPNQYHKIDNFYTATIYEKGAELIRMLKTILGDKTFRAGCDYYFDSLDGTAATVEQFIACFEKVSGQDLAHFMRWYHQAGTPHVGMKISTNQNQATLEFTQTHTNIKKGEKKDPHIIPIRWQVINPDAAPSSPHLTLLQDTSQTIELPNYTDKSTISAFQDFSAPIIFDGNYSTDDLLAMMGNDPNSFTRWEAGQTMARQLMAECATALQNGTPPPPNPALKSYISALGVTLSDPRFDASFKALVLTLPTQREVIQTREQIDPLAIYHARHWLKRAIGDHLSAELIKLYKDLDIKEAFQPDAKSAGRRALKNVALDLIALCQHPEAAPLPLSQLHSADNMTDEISALMTLLHLGGARIEKAMEDFYKKWEHNPLVIDKWFAIQGMRDHPDGVRAIHKLTQHPAYGGKNPNRIRALIGNFTMSNPKLFHRADGSGYVFFKEQIQLIDKINPQVAARLLDGLSSWRKYDTSRQSMITSQLQNIIDMNPSKNVREIAEKILQAR